jgi:hypothetical protein
MSKDLKFEFFQCLNQDMITTKYRLMRFTPTRAMVPLMCELSNAVDI